MRCFQILKSEHVGSLLGLLSQPLGNPCLNPPRTRIWAFNFILFVVFQVLKSEHIGSLLNLLSQPLGNPYLNLAVEVLWNALDAINATPSLVTCFASRFLSRNTSARYSTCSRSRSATRA